MHDCSLNNQKFAEADGRDGEKERGTHWKYQMRDYVNQRF